MRQAEILNPVLYASPYMVVTPSGYTKHYFVENERFASRIGDGSISGINSHAASSAALAAKQADVDFYAPDSIRPDNFTFLRSMPNHLSAHHTTYWQHSDHLGSASWVTDTNGAAYQHLQYMPWGEPLLDQRKSGYTYNTRYTFSGKERDEETGYSYFGARHYNSDLSLWLSVDPMADKYPGVSPYTYCANNPVRLVDPNGEDIYKLGVRIYFFNGDIDIGISYALSANMVSGIARDKGGVTRFQANSFNYIVNQNLNENSSKPSCFIGFDLSITAHAIWDWSANSFDDFVGKQLNTINLGVGPSASLTGGDCFIGIGIGGGYGGGYDIETLNVKRSISLSYNEVKRIKKLSNIVGFPIWEVANQKKNIK